MASIEQHEAAWRELLAVLASVEKRKSDSAVDADVMGLSSGCIESLYNQAGAFGHALFIVRSTIKKFELGVTVDA